MKTNSWNDLLLHKVEEFNDSQKGAMLKLKWVDTASETLKIQNVFLNKGRPIRSAVTTANYFFANLKEQEQPKFSDLNYIIEFKGLSESEATEIVAAQVKAAYEKLQGKTIKVYLQSVQGNLNFLSYEPKGSELTESDDSVLGV